jgi:hypothetical protein
MKNKLIITVIVALVAIIAAQQYVLACQRQSISDLARAAGIPKSLMEGGVK